MEAYRTPTEEGQAIAAKNYANATSDAAARNDVWLEAIRQQQANTSETYNALSEIRRREEYDRIEKEANNRDMIESAIATTPDGGTLSPNQVKHINRLRGLNVDSGEIQNGQIMEGGWNPKTGGYGFVFAQTDGNGNVTYTPSEISPNEIYGMMKNRPEWFSEDRITSLGNLMRKNDGSLVDSDFDGFARNYLAGRSARKVSLENARARMGSGLSVDDRLAIEREKNKGKIDVENARGQNRIDLANLTGEQKKELQNSINAMKKYGIDVTSAVRMAIGGNRTKNVPFNDKVFTYYSNRLDVLNSKGTLTAAEQKERDKAQRIIDGMTNGVMGIEEKQETPDWMSAFASGDAANTAKPQNREGQKSAQNAQVQKPSKTKDAQATSVQEQTAAPQGEPQITKEQTMSAKPQEQKRETTKLTPAEQSVGRDAVATFKKIHPDITDVDDNPEKYDKQLTSIAQSLSGDYNYKSNFTLQKERDRKAAQDKELQQTAAEQENLRKQTLANLNGRDKAVYQKAMELYAPLYERAKLQAREDHGGDYEESVRKKFAEYVNEYNVKHGLKFVDGLSRPDRQVFGDYHVADLLSDIFGNDAGKYLGPVGSRGNSQLRLQSHGKNK